MLVCPRVAQSDPFAGDSSLPTATWTAPPELVEATAETQRNIANAVREQQQQWIEKAKAAISNLESASPEKAESIIGDLPAIPESVMGSKAASLKGVIVGAAKCAGTCKATSAGCSGGTFHAGMCAGAANVQCCIVAAPACGAGGRCKATSAGCNGGTFKAGLCQGASNIQCCLPKPKPPAAPLGPACGRGGRCKATSAGCRGGSFQEGLCQGAANIKVGTTCTRLRIAMSSFRHAADVCARRCLCRQCCLPAAPGPSGGCGVYNGAAVHQAKGNGGRYFGVTPIKREHLSNPAQFGMGQASADNTLLMSTACAYENMRAAAARAGVTLKINSGFRSLTRQNYFWSVGRHGAGCTNTQAGAAN